MINDYYNIGRIAATHGLTGEVVLEHALGKKTDLKGLEMLFIEEGKGTFLPYFLEGSKLKSDTEVYVKLEGYNTKEGSKRLARREVWLLKADFEKFVGKSSPIGLLGYMMIEGTNKIGEIIEVIEQPMQVLCKVMINGNEALIPIHQESLKKIDHKKKEVMVDLPDGLLEIYS